MRQPTLFDVPDDAPDPRRGTPDQAARSFAVDPINDVVLEASAGTGKTRVLVDRYVRLLQAGVDPRNILAITFTRKAAAEMRERVLAALTESAASGSLPADRWRTIQTRVSDIAISTIDAFCFGLLREFPLEADVDPGFDVADETEIGRFATEALDLALRMARAHLHEDPHLRLLFARVKLPVLRTALAALLDRRQVAVPAVASFVRRRMDVGSEQDVCDRFAARLAAAVTAEGTRAALVDDGPAGAPAFLPVVAVLREVVAGMPADPTGVQRWRHRLARYFLTGQGQPRQKVVKPFTADTFPSKDAKRRHERAVATTAPTVKAALDAFDGDLDVLLARGLQRLLALAVRVYERLLEDHALLDFAGMLDAAVALLERQEEFARSRLKLQSRYHHLLVDEFQDTSRRQWRLVELLVDAWAEGEGLADAPTSIFVVGDRKQSIYRFRHAEVTLLDEAARRIGALRPGRTVRQAISTSFRAVPELLAFVNVVAGEMTGDPALEDRWRYDETDRFPVPSVAPEARRDGEPVLGLVAEATPAGAAAAVADEIARLLASVQVRDRRTGVRPARPDDVAILFRARAGHQFYEDALEARGIRSYVYKGLGFFDAPEVRDLQALIRFLAQPDSSLRAAEWLRSRFVRLSDQGLVRLGQACAEVATGADPVPDGLDPIDAALLARVRDAVPRWLAWVDRVPPSELVDIVIRESAYAYEIRGHRLEQARENMKKVRSLVRRVESRGYATFGRLSAYFETLRFGDDSNAVVDAAGAVNLMTIHAAKGLEFPIVFVVNLQAGGRGRPPGVSVVERGPEGEPEVTFGSTDATRLEDAREMEELRRLLYVAVTRARDRLYLAAEVDAHGGIRRQPRSLASLLPGTLPDVFAAVGRDDRAEIVWESPHGAFAFRACRAPSAPPTPIPDVPAPAPMPVVSVTPIRPSGLERTTARAAAGEGGPVETVVGRIGTPAVEDERLLGTLVHRLFQRRIDPDGSGAPAGLARVLLSAEERVDLRDPPSLVAAALDRYRRARARPDVAAWLASGTALYEVPFSVMPADRPGTCVRGVIDCVVPGPEATALILEFKTGEPRPEHAAQGDLYRTALEATGRFARVDVRLCYV